jgi:hypothetical protein
VTTPATGLVTSSASEHSPAVSSPTDAIGGQRLWLVCYERSMAAGDHDIWGILCAPGGIVTHLNLTALDGQMQAGDQITPHVDSDGCRFVVAWGEEPTPGADWDVRASTYHVVYGSGLGVTERRAAPGYTLGNDLRPRVTSTHSSGGPAYRYGLAWDRQGATADINVDGATFDGIGGGGLYNLNTGCDGLTMSGNGVPNLGGVVSFQMSGSVHIPVMMLGLPIDPIAICTGCSLGVNLGTASFVAGNWLQLTIPAEGAFVGGMIAVQGFTYGVGPCLGAIALSDTTRCAVR